MIDGDAPIGGAPAMSTASPAVRDLARRLLAHEAARAHAPDGRVEAAGRVLEELRVRLSKLMGVVGFSTLLSRAVALAKAEAPSLESVQVRTDGTLEDFGPAGQDEAPGTRASRGVVLIAHLLELLVTFIGAPLTLRLLRDAFPEAQADEIDLRNEEKR
jgi:hypothetical protein